MGRRNWASLFYESMQKALKRAKEHLQNEEDNTILEVGTHVWMLLYYGGTAKVEKKKGQKQRSRKQPNKQRKDTDDKEELDEAEQSSDTEKGEGKRTESKDKLEKSKKKSSNFRKEKGSKEGTSTQDGGRKEEETAVQETKEPQEILSGTRRRKIGVKIVLELEDEQVEVMAEQELNNCSSEMGSNLEKKELIETDSKEKEKEHSKASGTTQSKQVITQEPQQECEVGNQGVKETVEEHEPETEVPCDDPVEQGTQEIEIRDMAVRMVNIEAEKSGKCKREGLSGESEQKDFEMTETAEEVETQGVPTPTCQEGQVTGI